MIRRRSQPAPTDETSESWSAAPWSRRRMLASTGALALGGIISPFASFPLAGAAAPSIPRRGGSLAIGTAPDLFPETFNPDQYGNGINDWLQSHLFDTLVRLGPDGTTIEPALAERWEIDEEGLTYTFHLRAAAFHDGSPVTAADAAYSLERRLAWMGGSVPTTGAPAATDERTVVVRLPAVNASFLAEVTRAAVLPRTLVDAEQLTFFDHPVGSGPFRLDSWTIGSEVVLKRNPTYWDPDRPYLDELRFVLIGDPAEQLQRLRTGALDVLPYSWAGVPPSEIVGLASDDAIIVVAEPARETLTIGLNTGQPPLSDRTLRQAICAAIDRAEIAATVYHGFALPAAGLFSPELIWHDPFSSAPYDPAAAKQLVAASAGAGGFGGEIVLPKNSVWTQVARVVASQLEQIGGRITVAALDFEEVGARFGANRYAMFLDPVRWEPDPHLMARAVAASNSDGGLTQYPLAAFDTRLTEARSTFDQTQRIELYRAIERDLNDEAFWLFVAHPRAVSLMRNGVQGFRTYPAQSLHLWDVWRSDI